MLVLLALRNVGRHLRRLKPVMLVLVVGFSVLSLANSVLFYINDSSSEGLRASLTGDLSISSARMDKHTLIGSSSLLVGEYEQPYPLPFTDELLAFLNDYEGVAEFIGVSTIPALLELHATKERKEDLEAYYRSYEERGISVERQPEIYYSVMHPVIGVEFAASQGFLPGLELISGSFPPAGQPGFLVQEEAYKAMSSWLDPMGSVLRFTGNIDNRSFAIREIPLYGVYKLPVDDPALRGLVLADQDSVRALSGLREVTQSSSLFSAADAALLELDLNDLFNDGGGVLAPQTESGQSLFEGIEDLFNAAETVTPPVAGPDLGPWHFILIRLAQAYDYDDLTKALINRGFNLEDDILLRDWRATIGGSAVLSFILQWVLNAGALFVILGVLLLTTNAMMLSIFERTPEFGLMRALGASKLYVAMVVLLESMIIVMGSALIGLGLGALGTIVLNRANLELTNPYLVMLLGGSSVFGRLDLGMYAWHLAAAAFMALSAGYAPLRKVLGIQPSRAMV